MSDTVVGSQGRIGFSDLTGRVYVILGNGQKRLVPEWQVASLIAWYLDHNNLTVNGTKYGVLPK